MERPLDPYAAPRSDVDAPVSLQGTGAFTWEETEAFVGKNAVYYWKKWQTAKAESLTSAGFNWVAAVLSTTWLLYRRMYAEFFATLGIGLAVSFGLGVTMALVPGVKPLRTVANVIFQVAWVVIWGFIGNGVYLRKARKAIDRSRSYPNEEERLAFLKKQGGVTWRWIIITSAFSLLVLIGLAVFMISRLH